MYFRVPAKYDGCSICYDTNKGEYYSLYANELLTYKECKKFRINEKVLEPVRVSKIYWFFGKRFTLA